MVYYGRDQNIGKLNAQQLILAITSDEMMETNRNRGIKFIHYIGCQTGTKAIITGSDCCRFIFNGGRLVFGPQGLCLVGGDFARRSIQPGFPLASPGSIAQLTIVINTTNINTVGVDHRVIPWEPAQSRGTLLGAVVNDREEIGYR